MTVLLESKNCIVYGAGGGLASGICRTFAREGANLFLAGRRREPLEAVAADCPGAEVAVLDALDERAVEEHARGVAERAGSLDVSFNLVSRGDENGEEHDGAERDNGQDCHGPDRLVDLGTPKF